MELKMVRAQWEINKQVDTPLGEALTTGWGLASKDIVEVRLLASGIVKMFDFTSILTKSDIEVSNVRGSRA